MFLAGILRTAARNRNMSVEISNDDRWLGLNVKQLQCKRYDDLHHVSLTESQLKGSKTKKQPAGENENKHIKEMTHFHESQMKMWKYSHPTVVQ